ncbi:MAG: hypothetical protein CXT77_03630 [uncultured DHVE6 group euryarchaeote]|jgi:uncharacterized membrane protein|nr:MAG: hypothetical protein CXT77_03630 [uncultured DHVE6 group euryarchaeote]
MNSRKTLSKLIIVVGILGILFSILTIFNHFAVEDSSFCLTDNSTCDVVNKSIYSTLFGIPLGFFSIFYFIATLYFASKIYHKKKLKENIDNLIIWTVAGLIPVAYLIYVEAFKLLTFCSLCTVIHLIIGFNFALALLLRKRLNF